MPWAVETFLTHSIAPLYEGSTVRSRPTIRSPESDNPVDIGQKRHRTVLNRPTERRRVTRTSYNLLALRRQDTLRHRTEPTSLEPELQHDKSGCGGQNLRNSGPTSTTERHDWTELQIFSPEKKAEHMRSAIGWFEKTRGKRNCTSVLGGRRWSAMVVRHFDSKVISSS